MTLFTRSILSARKTPSLGPSSYLGTGYRRLAARVIYQAFRDLENPRVSPEHRDSARTFLTGSSVLMYWCELAQTDSAVVVARAQAQAPRSDEMRRPGLADAVLVARLGAF